MLPSFCQCGRHHAVDAAHNECCWYGSYHWSRQRHPGVQYELRRPFSAYRQHRMRQPGPKVASGIHCSARRSSGSHNLRGQGFHIPNDICCIGTTLFERTRPRWTDELTQQEELAYSRCSGLVCELLGSSCPIRLVLHASRGPGVGRGLDKVLVGIAHHECHKTNNEGGKDDHALLRQRRIHPAQLCVEDENRDKLR